MAATLGIFEGLFPVTFYRRIRSFQLDHEASCCQYEINFDYVDALTMADRHAFMKFMMKVNASQT